MVRFMFMFTVIAVVASIFSDHVQSVTSTPMSALDVKTFSSVLKGGVVIGSQTTLCYDLNATGVVQHMWFTMGAGMAARTKLKIYVDNEFTPAIEFSPTTGLSSAAPEDKTTPWGSEFHGRTGRTQGEGIFNTRRIPFGTRIRVMATFDIPLSAGAQSFFFIIRGLEFPEPTKFAGIVVGGLQLPPTARLKLHTTSAVTVKALDYLTIANVSANTGGLVYEVYMHANSTQFLFMEGCFRAFIDGDEVNPVFLSSGTEDYFNSANYFNAGEFRLPNSGLTYKNDESFIISAYRLHERDPVVFQRGLRFVWRNSDELPIPTSLDELGTPLNNTTITPPSWLCPITFPWYNRDKTNQAHHNYGNDDGNHANNKDGNDDDNNNNRNTNNNNRNNNNNNNNNNSHNNNNNTNNNNNNTNTTTNHNINKDGGVHTHATGLLATQAIFLVWVYEWPSPPAPPTPSP